MLWNKSHLEFHNMHTHTNINSEMIEKNIIYVLYSNMH